MRLGALHELASSQGDPFESLESRPDSIDALITRFPFLPAREALVIPLGWQPLFSSAVRRMASIVAPEEWGRSFAVTGAGMKDGRLLVAVEGMNAAIAGVLRKVARHSSTVCVKCAVPAILFESDMGLAPLCPACLALPALRRDLAQVLSWTAGVEGPQGDGLRLGRIPCTLRPSFQLWQASGGIDVESAQPWDLEEWLRALGRAQKALGRRR